MLGASGSFARLRRAVFKGDLVEVRPLVAEYLHAQDREKRVVEEQERRDVHGRYYCPDQALEQSLQALGVLQHEYLGEPR